MSWFQHNAWPVAAIRLLTKAKARKDQLEDSIKARIADDVEIKRMKERIQGLTKQIAAVSSRLNERRLDIEAIQRIDLSRLTREADKLTEEAKALKRAVPERVNSFIAAICDGTSYSAGFQIVWWNERFVILRLSGRRYFGGIGRRNYAKAEHRMYDLTKWDRKDRRLSGASLEHQCNVREKEGRIPARLLQEWKEEAGFRAVEVK